MPSQLMHKIESLIIGIRFSRSFRIVDISGEIMDELLSGDKTPFGPSFFPNLNDYSDEKILFNSDNNDFFRINNDEVVLRISVKNIDSDFKKLLEVQVPYIINNVFQKFKIKNISRFGMIFRHALDDSKALDEIVKNFSKGKIEDPNNVHFTFTKKLSITNLHGVENFINVISSYGKIGTKMIAELDYQKYFKPIMEDIRDGKIDEFMNEARRYLVNNFHPLLKEYYEKE